VVDDRVLRGVSLNYSIPGRKQKSLETWLLQPLVASFRPISYRVWGGVTTDTHRIQFYPLLDLQV
jgi:hypothetical protein